MTSHGAEEEKVPSHDNPTAPIALDGVYTVIVADDGALPAKTDEAKQAMLRQRKMFEIDSYYPFIKDHTYKTEFVPITFDEAKMLRLFLRGADLNESPFVGHYVNALYKKMDIAISNLKNSELDDADIDSKENDELVLIDGKSKSSHQNNILDPEVPDEFFIRLSTRSPKDAADKPIFRERLFELMREKFHDENGELIEEYPDLNLRLIGLRECFSKVLCVSSKEEMLRLLSYSERCVSDLKRLIDHRHLLDQWDLYLVIRTFEFIPICNEFRCFVCNGKLTAISQYFPHCLFPRSFRESTEQIKEMISDFYENVVRDECKLNDKLHDSYILDLNVDLQRETVMIIELNPFAKTTGTGFFDWNEDSDLLHGRIEDDDVYPEIRIRTEVDTHVDAVLNQWAPIFSDFEKRMFQKPISTCCIVL